MCVFFVLFIFYFLFFFFFCCCCFFVVFFFLFCFVLFCFCMSCESSAREKKVYHRMKHYVNLLSQSLIVQKICLRYVYFLYKASKLQYSFNVENYLHWLH